MKRFADGRPAETANGDPLRYTAGGDPVVVRQSAEPPPARRVRSVAIAATVEDESGFSYVLAVAFEIGKDEGLDWSEAIAEARRRIEKGEV